HRGHGTGPRCSRKPPPPQSAACRSWPRSATTFAPTSSTPTTQALHKTNGRRTEPARGLWQRTSMSHETIDPWLRRIVLHLEGSLPPDEVEELDRWRSSSAENDRLYREYEAIWREATGADGLGYVNWDAVASARPMAADLVMGRSRQTAKAGAVGRRPGARRRRFAVAAAIAAAVLLGFMGARVLLDDTPVYAQELITG